MTACRFPMPVPPLKSSSPGKPASVTIFARACSIPRGVADAIADVATTVDAVLIAADITTGLSRAARS